MTTPQVHKKQMSTTNRRIVVDCAGAVQGGAARFLREVEAYLEQAQLPNVELIGKGQRLTTRWLMKREVLAASAVRRISLNNAGFINPKGTNVTLLHNILQFATASDLKRLAYSPPSRLRVQIPIVRLFARSSSILVVPCSRMAEQVAAVSPALKHKLEVRFHPISSPDWAGTLPKNSRDVLLPIVPSPYKKLDQHILEFLEASDGIDGLPVNIVVPTDPNRFPELLTHPRIKFIGAQTSDEMDRWWRDSAAVLFPTEFEAFGFPLGEARVYGRNVIAQDTAQNREIAGQSLQSYTRHDHQSFRSAIEQAVATIPEPDPVPFTPKSYFDDLLGVRPHAGN